MVTFPLRELNPLRCYTNLKKAERVAEKNCSLYYHCEVIDVTEHIRIPMEEKPDFIGGAPNYEKYRGVDPEQVLVWLNID